MEDKTTLHICPHCTEFVEPESLWVEDEGLRCHFFCYNLHRKETETE